MNGRRPDGYHDIQSVFVPVDLCDRIDVTLRPDGRIVREGDLTGPEGADLAVRAALALQAHAATLPGSAALHGASLHVTKRIPVGAGLGGGSSDAATTLIALNRLWRLGLDRSTLAALGRRLGADVPFFLGQGPAFVEGFGEQCTHLVLDPAWFVVVFPQVPVSTAEIFSDPKLTRNTKKTTIAGFSAALLAANPLAGGPLFGANDLEAPVRARFAPVDRALRMLGDYAPARMSGSGSAVFCVTSGAQAAGRIVELLRVQMPEGWQAWAVPGLPELPLADW